MYERLIPIEIDTIGLEKHTYIQTYMSIQERSKLIPIERISMIPIETTIMIKCIHHITTTQHMHMYHWILSI